MSADRGPLQVRECSVLVAGLAAAAAAAGGWVLSDRNLAVSDTLLRVPAFVLAAAAGALWLASRRKRAAAALGGLALGLCAALVAALVIGRFLGTPAQLEGRDAVTGRLLWATRPPYSAVFLSMNRAEPMVRAQTGDGCNYGSVSLTLDPRTGHLAGAHREPNFRSPNFSFDADGARLAYSYDGTESATSATDGATGAARWRLAGPGTSGPFPTGVVHAGVAMLAVGGGNEFGERPASEYDFVDLASGAVLWRLNPAVVDENAWATADGTFYVVSGGTLVARDMRGGTVKWQQAVAPGRTAVAAGDDRVVVSGGAVLQAFRSDGSEAWREPAGIGGDPQVALVGHTVVSASQGRPRHACSS
ncbi:MAG TPA: PQQ-binding-like beta-propeller repeat protein [Acidimicrobiales bacterium]|nr:PQQ-binding-like beta-propeller repeat protein [Acidimicrobiales bacterium]